MNQDSISGSGVRRLRDRRRESTASEILSAAEQVFVERGFYETHMAEIAAKAGVAVGTLYNHYKDRDALVTALFASRKAQLLERLDQSIAETEGQPFPKQLREALRVIFTHFEEHWAFISMFWQGECGPPIMSASSLEIQRQIYQRWDKLVERARKQRTLRPKIAKLAPSLIMGITRSMLVRRIILPDEGGPMQHLDTAVDFFLEGAGVKPRASQADEE